MSLDSRLFKPEALEQQVGQFRLGQRGRLDRRQGDSIARLVVVAHGDRPLAAQAHAQACTEAWRAPRPRWPRCARRSACSRRPAIPGGRPGCARRPSCRPRPRPACRCRTGAPTAPGRPARRRWRPSARHGSPARRPPGQCRAQAACWRGMAVKAGTVALQHRVEIQFEQHRCGRQVVALAPARMQFADVADDTPVDLDARATPGVQCRMLGGNETAPRAARAAPRCRPSRRRSRPRAPCCPTAARRPGPRPGRRRAAAVQSRPRRSRHRRTDASRRNTRPISNTRTRLALRARFDCSTATRLPSRLERITDKRAGDRVQHADRIARCRRVRAPSAPRRS